MTSFGNNIWNSSIDVDDDDNEDDDGRRSVDSQNSIISPDELMYVLSRDAMSMTTDAFQLYEAHCYSQPVWTCALFVVCCAF